MGEDDLTSTWIAIARGLAAVSVLSIAAGFIIVLGNSGISLRDRVFEACESATAVTGSFALVAVVVLLLTRTPTERARGVLAATQTIGAVLIACAAYAAWYALTRHSHLPQTEGNTTFVAFVGLNWWYRTSGFLHAIATAVMGALILFAARRAVTRAPLPAVPDLGEGPADEA